MFDIGWTELALIIGAAIVVIGPEDMPRVLYKLGKTVRKIKVFAADVQASLDKITREAEVDEIAREINKTIGGSDLQSEIDRQIEAEEDRAHFRQVREEKAAALPPAQRAGEGRGEGGGAIRVSEIQHPAAPPPHPDPLPPRAKGRVGEREK